jgi:hypothetical protein
MAAVGVAAASCKARGPTPIPSRSGTSGTLTDPAPSTVTLVVPSECCEAVSQIRAVNQRGRSAKNSTVAL